MEEKLLRWKNNGNNFEYVYRWVFDTMGWLCSWENRGGCKMNTLEKLKDYNKETEKELEKLREVEAQRQKTAAKESVGGESDAGKEIKPIDKDQEFADKLLADSE